MERIACLLIGYVFGLFQTGYIFSKLHHTDIRNYGSGNSGATNVLRVMGKRAGLVVFLGDAFKAIFACLLTGLLFCSQPGLRHIYLLYTGLGVILGHNYPFYMGFRGGKGISATAGLMLVTDWRITLVCLVVFVLVVAVTRYVSLGSIIVITIFALGIFLFGSRGDYGVPAPLLPELYVLGALVCAMGIYRHHANIGRLLSGTENKLGAKKK